MAPGRVPAVAFLTCLCNVLAARFMYTANLTNVQSESSTGGAASQEANLLPEKPRPKPSEGGMIHRLLKSFTTGFGFLPDFDDETQQAEEADEAYWEEKQKRKEVGEVFSKMTPQQLLHWKHSLCGSRWPSSCADYESASTRATDGWMCKPDDGKINDITVYRNTLGSEFDGERNFHPRCVVGVCVKTAKEFRGVEIKKISEIGAQLAEWALEKLSSVPVNIDGRETQVPVRIRRSSSDFKEDISLQFLMVKFPSNGQSFKDDAAMAVSLKNVLEAVGAIETAFDGKVCGHGFTNGAKEELKLYADEFRYMMLVRALKVSKAVSVRIENPYVDKWDAVAHLVHAGSPAAGFILKLNGAAQEPCLASDWHGEPLLEGP